MTNFFPDDAYDTSPGTTRRLGDLLSCGTRSYFLYQLCVNVVFRFSCDINRGRYSDAGWNEISHKALALLEGCGAKIHIRGLSFVDKPAGPAVIVGNHMSVLETFILPSILLPRRKITFVVKKSLMTYPVFGTIMRATSPIAVTRENPIEDFRTVMNEGEALIKNGYSIIVFPQRTRTTVFAPEEFNSIGVKLAKKTGVPLIPLALKTDFWGNGKLVKDFGALNRRSEVHFEFGEPLAVHGNGKAEHQHVVSFIQERLAAWGHTPSRSA